MSLGQPLWLLITNSFNKLPPYFDYTCLFKAYNLIDLTML